jgi:hypothetical protein
MSTLELVAEDTIYELAASINDERVLVAADDLARATSWMLKPEGLCRDDVCVPVRDRAALVASDGGIDLEAFAHVLRLPFASEPGDDNQPIVAVLGTPAEVRSAEMASLDAPPFTLPDLDGNFVSLADFKGRKKLLLAWASW